MSSRKSAGRPKLPASKVRTVAIVAPCTERFRAKVNRAARKSNVSTAEFIRQAVREKIEKEKR